MAYFICFLIGVVLCWTEVYSRPRALLVRRLVQLLALPVWVSNIGCSGDNTFTTSDRNIGAAGAGSGPSSMSTSMSVAGTSDSNSSSATIDTGGISSQGGTPTEPDPRTTGGAIAMGGTSPDPISTETGGRSTRASSSATTAAGMGSANGGIGGQSTLVPNAGTSALAGSGSSAVAGSTTSVAGCAGLASSGGTVSSSTASAGSPATGGQSASGGASSTLVVAFVSVAGSPTDTTIDTTVELVNTTNSLVDLTGVTVRYWLTVDSSSSGLVGVCPFGPCGSSVVATGAINPARSGADWFVDYRFSKTIIAAGSRLQFDFQAHKSDWSALNELNDYSYPGDAKPGDELTRITVYQSGKLVWGTEP